MARASKPVWILCPRCELNYIKKSDQYCNVCKKEMRLIKSSEDDITDLELCPICKINFVQNDEEICDSCKQELGISDDEALENKELDDWHKYISDDDEDDDEDDELTDDVYDQDEVESTAGIVDDFDFADDLDKEDEEEEEDEDEDFDFDDLDDEDEEEDDDDDPIGDDFDD